MDTASNERLAVMTLLAAIAVMREQNIPIPTVLAIAESLGVIALNTPCPESPAPTP